MPSQPSKICDLECPLEKVWALINTNKHFWDGYGVEEINRAEKASNKPHEKQLLLFTFSKPELCLYCCNWELWFFWNSTLTQISSICKTVACVCSSWVWTRNQRKALARSQGTGPRFARKFWEFDGVHGDFNQKKNYIRKVWFWLTIQLATVPTVMELYLLWYSSMMYQQYLLCGLNCLGWCCPIHTGRSTQRPIKFAFTTEPLSF